LKLLVVTLMVAVAVAMQPPTFPLDWYAVEDMDMLMNQGGMKLEGTDYICCTNDENSQCKVQTANSLENHYFSYTTNQTRIESEGEIIVNYYAPVYKEMLVDPKTGNCTKYCPIEEDLYPLEIKPNATDIGQKKVGDIETEAFWWEDWVLIFPMQANIFYAKMNTDGSAIPVRVEEELTPFGEKLGTQNRTYTNYKAGPQDPKHFVVGNIDKCPKDPNCGDSRNSIRMAARLADRRYGDLLKMWQ
jgi:hypothetical protein